MKRILYIFHKIFFIFEENIYKDKTENMDKLIRVFHTKLRLVVFYQIKSNKLSEVNYIYRYQII